MGPEFWALRFFAAMTVGGKLPGRACIRFRLATAFFAGDFARHGGVTARRNGGMMIDRRQRPSGLLR
jgi:hypothetical protein